MNRTRVLYDVAGVLALLAAIVTASDGLVPDERFKVSFYVFWAAVMFALGYRRQQAANRVPPSRIE